MNGSVNTSRLIIGRARELRRNMTETEILLWDSLRKKRLDGYRFRKQHVVKRYILDFYCSKKKLAIEVDGPIHETRKEYDVQRDDYLKSIGIETLRFTNTEVKEQLDNVLNIIKTKLKNQ